jgi:hypothetical protein
MRAAKLLERVRGDTADLLESRELTSADSRRRAGALMVLPRVWRCGCPHPRRIRQVSGQTAAFKDIADRI